MVVEVVVALLPKLDLLQVDFDADLANVHVLQRQVLLQAERAFVGDVAERIQQLLRPALIQRHVRLQSLAQVRQQFLKRLALLNLEEVLIEIGVAHVIEAEVAGAVLRQQQLFCGANLVEELRQKLVVLEALRDQETLNG
eukprot:CAMPEP_0185594784 /NCGR_PEP_ID=MMETSP0434-20130131/76118_1 /TAXON_ID=626734 ORGANISM="Favella taraikaensis, Strain Fe Narragansett Bay" /NCGR_SAMPLE_ID=MMETSP0434 /ASSEMBLY_ACC=CAM_ASM_000379 /LENGTH=139 /DNA_ID=CAMNT_0028222341 /DNA_START=736 /DNA_END=1155 /DNA_ORIENTATION=-